MFDAVAVAGEGSRAVKLVHGGVEVAVGFAQVARHYVNVIQISKSRVRKMGAGVEDCMRESANLRVLLARRFNRPCDSYRVQDLTP